MDYNTADIRQFLTDAFSDDELMTLCFDHFRDVYNTYASGMTKAHKIQLLIEHCQRREIIHDLYVAMYQARPEQYLRRFPRVPSIFPEQASTLSARVAHISQEQPVAQAEHGESFAQVENPNWDVFISHAWEDKEAFARPLAEALEKRGLGVWFDEFTLRVGDSLRRSIERGLADSRYGIVILSSHFFAKEWPQKELDGLMARETLGTKVILPVWHNITRDQVRKYSPTMADRLAVSSERGLEYVVEELLRAIRPDVSRATTQASKITKQKRLGLQVADLVAQLGQAESRSEWDKVIEIGERILTLDPNNQPTGSKTAEAYKLRGIAHRDEGNCDKAIEHFTRAIKLDERAEYYFLRAQCYLFAKSKHDMAITDCNRALKLDEKAEYYALRGESYARKRKHGQAIRDYTQAIRLDPNQAVYYYRRGLSYESIQERRAALGDLERADELGLREAGPELARLRAAHRTG